MKEELLACIKNGDVKYLQSGQISKYLFPVKRKDAHLKHITHLITRFFIIAHSPKGEIRYLVQKRSKKKKEYPEYFTDSSSGHVIWVKNLDLTEIKKDAMRELEEEFGIPSRALHKTKFYELSDDEDSKEREISYVFFGLVDYNTTLKPNPNELDIKGSRFYERVELESILENQKNIAYTKKIWYKLIETDISSLFKVKTKKIKSKRKEIALFIGRFQPLHRGHIYVLEYILNSYKIVKIGIGSSQLSNTRNDPFTSEERKEFIKATFEKRRILSNRYKIYEIPDIFNAKKWVDHVISIVGEFDSIFSNSQWVRELFLNKEIRVEKKIPYFIEKYNGSHIRNLVLRNNEKWRDLIPKEITELIEEFNGINRIKSLYKEN